MHVPVLLNEVLYYLNPQKERFIDGTVGSGGHTIAILKANPKAKVLGIDLDQTSLEKVRDILVQEGLDQRCELVHGNYKDLDKFAAQYGLSGADGVLLDIGFSSLQVDDPARGFSFQTNGPLDMRYSSDNPLTAEEVVNRYQPKDLERIISEYGEEKFARRIVSNIVRNRRVEPIRITTQLAEIVRKSLPVFGRKANETVRRVFQALRIEVNSELENLKIALPKALEVLNPHGRLVVISFHSLEDRIVKEFFNQQAKDCICPPEFPTCICGKASTLRILTRKPITAQESEILKNSRSKPAKLRAAEKI